MRLAAAIMLGLLLAACAGPGHVPMSGVAERPTSEHPVLTDARAAAKVHVELGSAYFQSGRFGVALDEARVAQAFDPGYAPVFHLFGQIYMYLDDIDAARRSFEEAVRLAPGDPEIANSYGWFLCASGREREGLERLSIAMRNPYYRTPERPFTNAGLCYLRLKDDGAAEAEFMRAAQADPKSALARFHLAAIAYRRGQFQLAQSRLSEVHNLVEAAPDSLWLGLRIARKLGQREAENDFANQLRNRFPASPERGLLDKGQFD